MSFIVKEETFFGGRLQRSKMLKVQTQTDALTHTAMKAIHQRYTLCVSNTIIIRGLLISPYAGSLSATTRTSSSRKEMPRH